MVSISVSKRGSQVDCVGKFLKLYSMLKVPFKDVNLEFHSLLSLAISSEVNQSQAKRKNKVKFLFSQFFVVPQKVF